MEDLFPDPKQIFSWKSAVYLLMSLTTFDNMVIDIAVTFLLLPDIYSDFFLISKPNIALRPKTKQC